MSCRAALLALFGASVCAPSGPEGEQLLAFKGGEYVLYQDDTVWNLTDEQAAMLLGVKPEELGKPFLFRFPLGLLILGGVVAAWVVVSRMGKKQPAPPPPAA